MDRKAMMKTRMLMKDVDGFDSIEPGFYWEGNWGMRHESCVFVKPHKVRLYSDQLVSPIRVPLLNTTFSPSP